MKPPMVSAALQVWRERFVGRALAPYTVPPEAGAVAQLGEHRVCNAGVASSILVGSIPLNHSRTPTPDGQIIDLPSKRAQPDS